MVDLVAGERKFLYLDPVKMLIYGWFGFSYYYNKKVIVTNKRVIVSFRWFECESFCGALSCYYKKKDFDKCKKYGSAFILKSELCKDIFKKNYVKLVLKHFIKFKIRIYGRRGSEIQKIIAKNS